MAEAPPIPAWRDVALARLGRESFDLLVIGGGITGAGVARDAALRGMRVALVEKDDFAGGTSSRSTRLVHGGIRYLEHGHLHLVFESQRERRILLRIAPHLVRPLAFTWPVYRGARIARWKLRTGLALYDALALFRNVAPHQSLSPAAIAETEPALRRDGLVGGARYYDAAADDARLTLANVVDTAEHGGVVINHAAVVELLVDGGRASGAVVRDGLGHMSVRVRARTVVNATGPWTDNVRALEGGAPRATVLGSKGAHIAVPRERIGNRDAVVLLAPEDGRVMFALPAGDTAVIGTTETSSTESPDDVRASSEDVRYLLATANAHFPAADLRGEDVLASWAGLRPLVATLVHGARGSASREHSIDVDGRRVVHVTGGKLTTYRAMAQEIVDVALQQTGGPASRGGATSKNPLPGGDTPSVESLMSSAAATIADARIARRLVRAHGTRWRDVWSYTTTDPGLAEPLGSGGWTPAEVVYAMEREFACSLGDALIRRLHLAFELPDHGREAAARVVRVIARRGSICGAISESAALDAYDAEARRIFG